MSGRSDWSANVINAQNVNNPARSPHRPPGGATVSNPWHPSADYTSVEECAKKAVTFKSEKGETVSACSLRVRALVSRFESAVEKHAKGSTPR